ncbi:MAG: DUF6455 family protein [Rhodospirillales bacterium]
MSATAYDTSLFGRLFDWIQNRLRSDNELSALSHSDFAMMATDLGICESDLREVLPKTADNSALMDEMMLQRGLNPDRVRRLAGGLARDLEMTCSRCSSVNRCRRELALGIASANAHEYCGNAEIFDELLAGA